jgi:hypothetical protein
MNLPGQEIAAVVKARPLNGQSPRCGNFRLLAIPFDLAAQPVGVLVQDLEGRNCALVPVLNPPEYAPDIFMDRASAQVRD